MLSKHKAATTPLKRLLHVVWRKSLLLQQDQAWSTCQSIVALRNLALYAPHFAHSPEHWEGSREAPRAILSSLAAFVFGDYPMPSFLGSVWFGDLSKEAKKQRTWVVEHAKGKSFRSLDLPFSMTRRMEHLFLRSPTHLSLHQAMRQCELLSLGASPELVRAVLATHLGEDLSHGAFWRTVMAFFVRVGDDLSLDDVGPIVDYLHCLRCKKTQVETVSGTYSIRPSDPNFSMKGRSLSAMLRRVDLWHESLASARVGGAFWLPSGLRPLRVLERAKNKESPALFWEMVELTNARELKLEGTALRHCVATYIGRCLRGSARIWSLRTWSDSRDTRSVLTIEVNPQARAIVQIRGMRNRRATGRPLEVLESWARQESLRLPM